MEFRTRKIVKNGDLNGANTLFGGMALAWIDEEAAVFAACQMNTTRLVTAAISTIVFKSPGHLGDFIEIGCDVVSVGNSSLTVTVVMRNKTTQKEMVTVDKIVFVALDEHGNPTPHGMKKEREENAN